MIARRRKGEVVELYPVDEAEPSTAGPLDALLADPSVTDVLVNAPDEVWVERDGQLMRSSVTFPDDEAVRRLAVGLATATGRRLDSAAPFVDARLPDGTRLHAVLYPVAVDGTCLSLRRPRTRPFTFADLVHAGTLAPGMAATLAAVVDARLATVVTGATGSGKTTMLAAILGTVPTRERIVLVEDTSEILLDRAGVVRLEARPPNVEGAGRIDLRDLVRQALRMRPDRLVVGEVRGPEILDLLVAFNTGHTGGLSTVHANTASELPSRLEALAALAGLDRPALHSLLAAALDVVVHLHRGPDGVRRAWELGVASSGRDGYVSVVPALAHPPRHLDSTGPLPTAGVVAMRGRDALRRRLEQRGVRVPAPLESSLEPTTPHRGTP
jgi:pilus assembly protein CpaF